MIDLDPIKGSHNRDTIVAVTTGTGGAVAAIRLSGGDAIGICDKIFESRTEGKKLRDQGGFTMHYGNIVCKRGAVGVWDGVEGVGRGAGGVLNGEQVVERGAQVLAGKDAHDSSCKSVVDDVIISLFRAPRSYTGEDIVEISCHASSFVKNEIVRLCIENGARAANAGEFTMRAFLNGKLDLSQAEAVADVIASDSRSSHSIASKQMRGGYSLELNELRDKLIELSSLLELELDFSEEDVEFADRSRLLSILEEATTKINALLNSFALGNSVKNGTPVAIVGSPNAGKSTLLNALLNEEKAMVSEIAGTTRDTIEETLNIGGLNFRFIDTAGIRKSDDRLEQMGIERTHKAIERADIVLLVIDPTEDSASVIQKYRSICGFSEHLSDSSAGFVNTEYPSFARSKIAVIINKSDISTASNVSTLRSELRELGIDDLIVISAKEKLNIEGVKEYLIRSIDTDAIENDNNIIVFNSRHYASLLSARDAAQMAQEALINAVPGDLLSEHIREILFHLGTITGEITNDEILSSIFSKFCIGK